MPTGRPVEITRTVSSAMELRRATARNREAHAARRMLAITLVLEGKSRAAAAENCGMDRQTLRDWVIRYNEMGLAGLSDRVPPGPAFRRSRRPSCPRSSRGALIRPWITWRGALAARGPTAGDRCALGHRVS
jgi:transposase-like protein